MVKQLQLYCGQRMSEPLGKTRERKKQEAMVESHLCPASVGCC